jgi:amino acid transporter
LDRANSQPISIDDKKLEKVAGKKDLRKMTTVNVEGILGPSTMNLEQTGKANFGTVPVFLTSISTILGAILFLRFGYAVGHVGFLGVLFIIALGHLVTIPTAFAIAEISTNQRVQGGGEYYIISRSFGAIVGSAIGISLFLSRAISVAFYVIALAEAFDPALNFANESWGWPIFDKRLIGLLTVLILTLLILAKGAALGMKMLYAVVGTLGVSLLMFFLGDPGYVSEGGFGILASTIDNPDRFFVVFAICFPAFTGMTAGVGLSGDLREPRKSIPMGTLSATLVGMVIYILVGYKLALSASPESLAGDQLIMSKIALWGPIIPIGLAAASLSSAVGSYLVAPRILQAIAADRVLPWPWASGWLSRLAGRTSEPVNAALVTAAIALAFVVIGDVDFVAKIISMFFMITYGSICAISVLEHFAADPAYRPTFRSRWYISLLGALMCVWLMFQMSQFYALLAVLTMFVLYMLISRYNEDKQGLSNIVQGAIFQMSRQLQVFLQKSRKQEADSWRPSVVCISKASFERLAAFDLLRWISHRYGFGTYIHFIEGYLSRTTEEQAQEALQRLVRRADVSESNVYVDTMVSPSYTTAIAQLVQLPGISGKENNMVLFEYAKTESEDLANIVDNYQLVTSTGFDVCILASSDRGFGYSRRLHVWISSGDYENANLMILLAYILLGHPDWQGAVIQIFNILPEKDIGKEKEALYNLVRTGRLSISAKNVEFISSKEGVDRRSIINERSRDADLAIIGFRGEALRHQKTDLFSGYEGIGNVLFVNTKKEIEIVPETEDKPEVDASPDEESSSEEPATPAEPDTQPEKAPPTENSGQKT